MKKIGLKAFPSPVIVIGMFLIYLLHRNVRAFVNFILNTLSATEVMLVSKARNLVLSRIHVLKYFILFTLHTNRMSVFKPWLEKVIYCSNIAYVKTGYLKMSQLKIKNGNKLSFYIAFQERMANYIEKLLTENSWQAQYVGLCPK